MLTRWVIRVSWKLIELLNYFEKMRCHCHEWWRNSSNEFYEINFSFKHYNDVIMGAIASQITSLTIVYSNVYSDADQRKYQSSASLVFVREIHRGPMNSPHKWPVTRKMFPIDDVIMIYGDIRLIKTGMRIEIRGGQRTWSFRYDFNPLVKWVKWNARIQNVSILIFSNLFYQ